MGERNRKAVPLTLSSNRQRFSGLELQPAHRESGASALVSHAFSASANFTAELIFMYIFNGVSEE